MERNPRTGRRHPSNGCKGITGLLGAVLLILATSHVSFSQGRQLKFQNYSIEDGLSQTYVTDVLQDGHGFIWIATQDGLNRYDGQQFVHFRNQPDASHPRSLPNNYVQSLAYASNQLWIATDNGLARYDLKADSIHPIDLGQNTGQVLSVWATLDGQVWALTSTSGVFFIRDGNVTQFWGEGGLPQGEITGGGMIDGSTPAFWVREKGLFQYDPKTKGFEQVLTAPEEFPQLKVNTIESLAMGHILCTDQGVFWLGKHGNTLSLLSEELQEQLGPTEYRASQTDNENKIWLAHDGGGLIELSREDNTWKPTKHTNNAFVSFSLIDNRVNDLFLDGSGSFWVATEGGLSRFDHVKQGFQLVTINSNREYGLIDKAVWSFAEVGEERLAVGTTQGLSIQNLRTGAFKHYEVEEGHPLHGKAITAILPLADNKLLLGTHRGLYELDRTAEGSQGYSAIPIPQDTADFTERIYDIEPQRQGGYLLGCLKGVAYLDRENDTYAQLGEWNGVNLGTCRFIQPWKKGYLATFSKYGVCQISYDSTFHLKEILSPDHPCLKGNQVLWIYQDGKDLWLGVYGGGLVKYDLTTGDYKLYDESFGLANEVVYAILPDDNGNIWFSTNRGITRFLPRSEELVNYHSGDGLQGEEFNAGAAIALPSGELAFGGINGFNIFSPSVIPTNSIPPRLSFTHMEVMDKQGVDRTSEVLHMAAPFAKVLKLDYDMNNLRIGFSAMHFSNSEKNTYKYRLVDLSGDKKEEMVLLGPDNEINFSALPPGDYRLEVYASNADGVWSSSPLRLTILISPPWWSTWWFRLTALGVIGILILAFFRRRVEHIRREKVKLELRVAERTRELREQSKKLEEQKRKVERQKKQIESQKKIIEGEKVNIEKLLFNILPEQTAEELKSKGRAKARSYHTVSVMFTDFVGFSNIAQRMRPQELVQNLDSYFREFDRIIEQNNLEKIKTIGDAYMCAGGLPIRNKSNPIEIVLAGLQVQGYMAERAKEDEDPWQLRLGINTGECIAGVIGLKRFAYDIWGNTVNLAQRMEAQGEPGRVNVSEATFEYIEPYFECTHRGKVKTKHVGMVNMYFVDRIKPELSADDKGLVPNDKFWKIVNLHLFSSINYMKAERHIMKVLEAGLSESLHYHGIHHTKDVTKAAERLAIMEGITDEDLFLLKSAATYHDAGFVDRYDDNEEIGVLMAEEILPKYGYTRPQVVRIGEMIHATKIPHEPKNHLEQILCDADLDYLGRDDFHQIADTLRVELREHGKIQSDRQWDEIQVKFLKQHRYFTESAIRLRRAKKEQHVKEIEERLERNEYAD